MVNSIYEKIINERNSLTKKRDPNGFELDVLSYLWGLAFINNDKLPESFNLDNIHMSKYVIENLLHRLSINATVTLTNCSHGASYCIKLN
ncbi:MAG: hypothetical protein HFJ41_00250 [Clostridia bacterium]|nr:hypothetical protein [Clostridia bacterium]